MKKLLLGTAAVGLALSAMPAQAAIDLELGGFFKGYGAYTNQDDDSAVADSREFDILRTTEIHIGGETTLDNGLTVGAHFELLADNQDSMNVQESYVYFAGNWGRVNFGSEDGAAFLLQVAAPSGDSNIDGIRQYIDPLNYGSAAPGGTVLANLASGSLDYDQNPAGYDDKLTYLSPIMNGFQIGLSYTPDITDASGSNAANTDDVANNLGSAYEAAVRYEAEFNGVGVLAGAGYTNVDLEQESSPLVAGTSLTDDREVWNVGLDLDFGPFGVGAIYTEDDYGDISGTANDEEETWVVGVDYTTGPFKLGASYLNQDNATGIANLDAERYTGGVVYTYGPGMTFRGSISHVEYDNVAGLTTGTEFDATSVLLGTQIKF